MADSSSFDELVPPGLRALGIEASEDELAVMRVAHDTYWGPITELLALDLGGVEPEPVADMSEPPPPAP
jgi:hypothetical protein